MEENKKYCSDTCGLDFFENEDKCILHCTKNNENGWYIEKEVQTKEWNLNKINKFWNEIQKELNDIYEKSFLDTGFLWIEYKDIIFPKFQNDIEFCEYKENGDDLGTNFYSYGICNIPNQQSYPEVNKVIQKLDIKFINCKFLDEANFKRYKFEKQIEFIECKFEKEIVFPDEISVTFKKCNFNAIVNINKLSIIKPTFKPIFDNCKFNSSIHFSKEYIEIESNLFHNCLFKDGIYGHNITFKGKIFNNSLSFSNNEYKTGGYYKIKVLHLTDCIFKDSFLINNFFNSEDHASFNKKFIITSLRLTNSIFKKEIKVLNTNIEWGVFNDTTFEELVDFSYTNFEDTSSLKLDVSFNFSTFKYLAIFNNVTFKNNVNFNGAKFLNLSSFVDTIFEKKLDLKNTIFKDNGNFVNIKATVKNRETARLIKNTFTNQNNIIESNKYYAIEMSEKRKEIEFKNNPFDWLVFTLHRYSSNHSQNYLLALSWIIVISVMGIFPLDTKCENINIINKVAVSFFNLISFKVTNPTMYILTLKVSMAYLIYQFVISIRQNTRRK